jgi:hypothetical protein
VLTQQHIRHIPETIERQSRNLSRLPSVPVAKAITNATSVAMNEGVQISEVDHGNREAFQGG